MFKVGDAVKDLEGRAMTVDRVEKCLDCNKILITCVWVEGANVMTKLFGNKELVVRGRYDHLIEQLADRARQPARVTGVQAYFHRGLNEIRWTINQTDQLNAEQVNELLGPATEVTPADVQAYDPATATGERLQELMTITGFDDPNTDPF